MAFALGRRHFQLKTDAVENCDKPVDTMPGSFQRTPKPKSKGKGTIPTTPDIKSAYPQPQTEDSTSSQ